MKCCNCLKEIPDGARSCKYCEATQETPKVNPGQLAQIMASIPPDDLTMLHETAMESDTMEDFLGMVLCGPCPKCGSEKTEDCADIKEYLNPFLGRCKECCALFCTECGCPFDDDAKDAVDLTKCPVCASTNTDYPTDDDEDSLVCQPELHCFDCGATYCFHCGTVRAD
ncbi:MAG: hypothetical protein J0M04_24635 [Verrucomicrobia bacterium]|nr:hypothetical protein [Verrucomicrobiota bacterium]